MEIRNMSSYKDYNSRIYLIISMLIFSVRIKLNTI